MEGTIQEIVAMLPLPNHLLNIDPQEVLREIEEDPVSHFAWSLRSNLSHLMRGHLNSLALKPCPEPTVSIECCNQ
jgi:hypothetical protein